MSNKKSESLARAIDAAIQAFSTLDYDEVMIADIAVVARCSTATLYDAFGSKQQLYEHVRQHLFRQHPRQIPMEGYPVEVSLDFILNYLVEMFAALTSPAIAMLLHPAETSRPNGYQPMVHTGLDFDTMRAQVERCIDAGLLRQGDPHAFTFLMFAGMSYEPLLNNILCREAAALDCGTILISIFDPLLTDAGAEQLRAYVARLDRTGLADDAEPTFHELIHFGSLTQARADVLRSHMQSMRAGLQRYLQERAPKA